MLSCEVLPYKQRLLRNQFDVQNVLFKYETGMFMGAKGKRTFLCKVIYVFSFIHG